MDRLRDTLPPGWSATTRGEIRFRQTTYWDVVTDGEPLATRVHFIDKIEYRFVSAAFDGVELTNDHPILSDHVQPFDQLFVSTPPGHAARAAEGIAARVANWSSGWRTFERYANTTSVASILQTGHGCLISAPRDLVRAVGDVLSMHGAQYTVVPGGRPRSVGAVVLRLGDNFVAARHVEFERHRPVASVPVREDARAFSDETVQRLFTVFCQYSSPGATFCDFCNTPEEIRRIIETPLEDLDHDSGRRLLWESADHWESSDVYRHYLPRMLQVLGPPWWVEDLYPLHLFETLLKMEFRKWSTAEQAAVIEFLQCVSPHLRMHDDESRVEWSTGLNTLKEERVPSAAPQAREVADSPSLQVELYFLRTDEGGRRGPADLSGSGYRSLAAAGDHESLNSTGALVEGESRLFGIVLQGGPTAVAPGEVARAELAAIFYPAGLDLLADAGTFTVFEGLKVVARGKVLT
jgi:hypothetical protein